MPPLEGELPARQRERAPRARAPQLVAIEPVAAALGLVAHRREVRVERSERPRAGAEARELRVARVAAGGAAEHGAREQAFAPHGHEAGGVEIARVQAPEAHGSASVTRFDNSQPCSILERASTVVPYLCINGAAQAIEFYKKAFGAREVGPRIAAAGGRVGHAEIAIGESTLMLADEHPELKFVSPQTLGGAPVQFFVAVADVDAMVARAVQAGSRLTRPIADQFYGHRTGEITDPFGYRWTLATKIEDVSDEEIQRRAKAAGRAG
jgi:PhnB protein